MAKYNTRAMTDIEHFLSERKGEHITINQIYEHFVSMGNPIGKTTIYRRVEDFVSSGLVKKHIIDKSDSAYFEYIGTESDKDDIYYHLMCEKCGKIVHFRCSEAGLLWKHLSMEHNFQIDIRRVVLYGICDECKA